MSISTSQDSGNCTRLHFESLPPAALNDAKQFRTFAGCYPTGVTVVTTKDRAGNLHGATMNSVVSLSLEPPLYLMCFGAKSSTLAAVLESQVFAINFLASHQQAVSQLFASKEACKFTDVAYELADNGAPVLNGVAAACDGFVFDIHGGGDHTIVVGKIDHVRTSDRQPLLFHRGQYRNFSQ